ncbi:AAA-domain-containing protein [Clavulina sp. PMI_390]|nr:AAA-domain-containing protein [Clavulina sp. PMI_390]
MNQREASIALDTAALRALVGGMDRQIKELSGLLELPLSRPELFKRYGLKPPRGVLLWGPPGTGKTYLARCLADSCGASLLAVSGSELSSAFHGETEGRLRTVFNNAIAKSPCIILFDEIDALCPKREDTGSLVEARVVATLLTLMDGITGSSSDPGTKVVVVATTNRPNAIDPALRRPGRFDREIELGVPDALGRNEILKVLMSKIPHNISVSGLQKLSSQTHGFVAADLAAAVRDAGTRALHRFSAENGISSVLEPCMTVQDIEDSLRGIRPSALRENLVETPQVLWGDIGGQDIVKQKLKECVEWPLKYPQSFVRFGITPPRGVLLYGPPGCSKTMTARALATEGGINFLAVKGPELINKYVGESERALRDIFRKARAAAPSILFFDEIDALAGSRASEDGRNNQQGVLITLLTEMDGLQDLGAVIVVAATNRPDTLDSALMRPGRLDRILYVGPPDDQSRSEILQIQLRKMRVEPGLDVEELVSLTKGCSGAEIVSMCQDAGLLTMKRNMDAEYVAIEDFRIAARTIRRQITPSVIASYINWQAASGVSQA